jgi:hypothetical protein
MSPLRILKAFPAGISESLVLVNAAIVDSTKENIPNIWAIISLLKMAILSEIRLI